MILLMLRQADFVALADDDFAHVVDDLFCHVLHDVHADFSLGPVCFVGVTVVHTGANLAYFRPGCDLRSSYDCRAPGQFARRGVQAPHHRAPK